MDELKYLPGMSQALYDRLSPFVTVYSGRGGLNMEYAPPALITALTGEDVQTAEQPDGNSAGGPRNGTFHIYASASGSAGTVAAIEAVVRIRARRKGRSLSWTGSNRRGSSSHPGKE